MLIGSADAHQRRAAAAEGAAARSARHRRDGGAPRRQARRRRDRPGAEDPPHAAWRQAVGRARALGRDRRRRELHAARAARRRASPASSSSWAGRRRSAARRSRAKRSRSASSIAPRPATRSPTGKQPLPRSSPGRAARAGAGGSRSPPRERKDDVKLGQALHKLVEEDPSLIVDPQCRDRRNGAGGPGRDASAGRARAARRALRHHDRRTQPPRVGYKETIRKAITQRGRHKKQSGGHGQFGDVVLDIKPLPRGSGFQFADEITGGVVPRQLYPLGRGGRDRVSEARAARLPGGRRRASRSPTAPITRSIPPTWRSSTRRASRMQRGHAAMPAGAARADRSRRDRRVRPTRRRRSTPSCRSGAGRSSASTRARLEGLGRGGGA